MTKPTFIFFGGLGWAGTTSLYYTLLNSEYMHGGASKEHIYLEVLFKEGSHKGKHIIALPQSQQHLFNQYIHLLYFLDISLKNIQGVNSYLYFLISYTKLLNDANNLIKNSTEIFIETKDFSNIIRNQLLSSVLHSQKQIDSNDDELIMKQGFKPLNQNPALAKFTMEDINEIYPVSLNNYCTYYRKLWKYCQETNSPFKAVGDFANIKLGYSLDTLKQIKEALDPYFNVKAIQIFRDPLRRAFSCCSSRVSISPKLGVDSIFKGYESFIRHSHSTDYAKTIATWREAFGKENYHYVIMEDFFDPNQDEEREKLEKFLDYKIPKDKIFPCAFVPDRGINAPKLPGVRDQWASDIVKFEPELYMEHRYTTSGKVYKNFKKLHGYLPANWGKPIDYGYND